MYFKTQTSQSCYCCYLNNSRQQHRLSIEYTQTIIIIYEPAIRFRFSNRIWVLKKKKIGKTRRVTERFSCNWLKTFSLFSFVASCFWCLHSFFVLFASFFFSLLHSSSSTLIYFMSLHIIHIFSYFVLSFYVCFVYFERALHQHFTTLPSSFIPSIGALLVSPAADWEWWENSSE